jgi:peptide/nickel transport system permease protein
MSAHAANARHDDTQGNTGSAWALIVRRLAKRRSAMASLHVLAALYLMSLFAEVLAPYPPNQHHLDYVYAPPQPLRWTLKDGLHVLRLQPLVDPVTFRKHFRETDHPVPVRWMAKSSEVQLLGLIPTERRLLQVEARPNTGGATLFLLGADKYGRDIFSRAIFGARVSLTVGLVGILLSLVLGVALGGISGCAGGRTDEFIQRGVEVIHSLPQLPLWIAFAAIMPASWSALSTYFAITLLLGLLGWTNLARVVRGKVLAIRHEDYVAAARLAGASHGYLLCRHLLPACLGNVIATLTLSMPAMILGETALSFLGLGLRPPVVSWGVMLQDCLDLKVAANYPWLLMPGVLVVMTVLCFNFICDGLRDATDPYVG